MRLFTHTRPILTTAVLGLATTALAACGSSSPTTVPPAKIKSVVLVTHDSWVMPKAVLADFTKKTGYVVTVRASGDAGLLTNKLILSAGNPDGDVSFGVDNTLGSRALSNNVFAAYTPSSIPAGVAAYNLAGDNGSHLTPVDHSAVCVDVDLDWFKAHKLAVPTGLDDLIKPAYKNLLVTESAAASSPGTAFLLATIAAKGTGWQDYWKALLANGTQVAADWTAAYEGGFTQGGGKGTRPIVVSYNSDPAAAVSNGQTSIGVVKSTCFGQVEYAGVLAGAKNAPGAQAFIDFLLTPEVQKELPGSMYVFPVVDGVALPSDWTKFAYQPTQTLTVPAADIAANRDQWLQTWNDIVSTH
ncbi:thiamine ABC transporter substrate-binding protein [Nocardioides baekrokdamisoli]|uniref:Thiamine ABC transporter substrate-binding protein n=1 Tax=Nocardioides baekrokdamisoli TaxID=1804624 RepID=A0A3G9IZF0_9ACTN|nr:thiamine ABC transporter substrate-binding protein [Nocardioides baekrokdamisoli]BBH17773.1 thiamine ABC transporter substrate-binding protein [Nocardioides baekrokdamisoli]